MSVLRRLGLALLGALFGTVPMAGQVIHFPTYGQHKDWQWMEVYRVELTPGAAVFDVTLYGAPGERLRLLSGDALRGLPSGRTCRLLRAEGAPLDSLVAVPDSGSLTLRLAFEPVAAGDTAVDWLSGADGHKVYDALSLRAPSAGGGGVTCHIAGRVDDTTRVSRFLLLPEGVDPRVVTPLSLPVRGGRFARTCRFPRPMRVGLIAYEQLMRGAWMPATFFAENGRVDVSWRGDERADVASDGALGRQDSAMRAEHRARFKPRLEPYYDRMDQLSETEAYYTAEGKALFDTLDVVMRRYYIIPTPARRATATASIRSTASATGWSARAGSTPPLTTRCTTALSASTPRPTPGSASGPRTTPRSWDSTSCANSCNARASPTRSTTHWPPCSSGVTPRLLRHIR